MTETLNSDMDILMVTHDRPHYTRQSLGRLLETCDDRMRVWVWHNGDDPETLDVVNAKHDQLHRFHHSPDNRVIRDPINWLFDNARGDLLSLVNDDCVVSDGWAAPMRSAHRDIDDLGVVACWHFQQEDFVPGLARHKIRTFSGGHTLMVNPWVQGSGVVLKRRCVEQQGPLSERERGFTPYCIRLAAAGWINGWYLPLVPIDHMDDPRSVRTALKTDADLAERPPLSAVHRGTSTIDDWDRHLRMSARVVQEAPADPRLYVGLRKKIRRCLTRLKGQVAYY